MTGTLKRGDVNKMLDSHIEKREVYLMEISENIHCKNNDKIGQHGIMHCCTVLFSHFTIMAISFCQRQMVL